MIRVSGDKAGALVRKLCPQLTLAFESHKAYFSELYHPENNEIIDEALITFFKKGKSYTGEETVEISCHGNPRICETILKALVSLGARLAERGEFTYRAFMNGKIDLVQAESVLATIESQSKQATQLALRQLKGELSKSLIELLDHLVWVAAHIEASIDFSSEGLDTVDLPVVDHKLSEIEKTLVQLVDSYKTGRLIKEGFQVVFVGKPNVGKSSLLNLVLQSNRAIVTAVAGTTRDIVDGQTLYGGISFIVTDTAGLRSSQDEVELIGIQKSKEALVDADALIWVLDSHLGMSQEDKDILSLLSPQNLWICLNKSDLPQDSNILRELENLLMERNFFPIKDEAAVFLKNRVISVSANELASRSQILESLSKELKTTGFESSVSLSNARHFEALTIALDNISRCRVMLAQGDGSEFITFELKEAIMRVQEVLGKRFDDEIMDRVFKEFCIGK